VEKILSGDQRGYQMLKGYFSGNFGREWWKSMNEAGERLEHSRAEYSGTGIKQLDDVLTTPGKLMTAGDMASRNIMTAANLANDEAREITLTSEPYTKPMKGIAMMKRAGGPIIDVMLPFYRTNANQLEQSAERTPGLGLIMEKIKSQQLGTEMASGRQMLVKQGLGGGVAAIAYQLGTVTPSEAESPKNFWTTKLTRKFINDLGGQYGAIASAAFMAGQAARLGKDPILGAGSSFTNGSSLPIPTADILTDIMALYKNKTQTGSFANPNTGKYPLPSGTKPLIWDELVQAYNAHK
jgi:hypothetical protein